MSLTPQSTRYYHGLPTDPIPNMKIPFYDHAPQQEQEIHSLFLSNKSVVIVVNVHYP